MIKKFKLSVIALGIVLLCSSLTLTQNDLKERLESLPQILSVERIQSDPEYTEAFLIFIEQPLDHQNPDGKKFKQKFYLSHKDFNLPVVIELDGYNIDYNRANELASILKCNKIVVEHRYFGKSVSDGIDWNYLTIEQSANDHHKIIETLKEIYYGKWVTTGISKGGQTTYIHKYFFPDDAEASVCYVAPLNLAEEDPRIYHFLDNVGTKECRDKMVNFQREVLKRKDRLISLLKKEAEENG